MQMRADAATGRAKIEWAAAHMPLLHQLEARYRDEKPFAGLRVAMSIHLEAKTARLALLLREGGAQVHATGSNPLSTQDDVAAALAQQGVAVCARHGATADEYRRDLIETLSCRPHIVIDDGGDLVELLHEHPALAENVIGGCEETTTGVIRLKARSRAGQLRFPMVCVNDARMKYLFDNRYGTGQSVWDAIMRTTNLIVAGKTVVVAGYGWCGKGVALRAASLGAQVVVCEVDPVKAIEAVMDGHSAMSMDDAAKAGDLFVTVTGCQGVITHRHMLMMKPGAILCNAGHFNVEVAVDELAEKAASRRPARANIEEYTLENGNVVYLLAEGRLVNLAAGDGHPAEIMDISFALQALSAEYVARQGKALSPGAHEVPPALDAQVAAMKLSSLGLSIDRLTDAQISYLDGWKA
ncbi:MAG: adenosylhomocysteinase [Clostridiales bacterium]|nr:adenosylhomocysteinase [Clostridiales bacterium]